MVDLMHLIFDVPLLYYYGSLNSSIICCLFSGDMYLSFGVSDSSFTSIFCDRNFVEEFFETLVILSPILLLIKSPITSAIFWIALFEVVFIACIVDFLQYEGFFDHIYCVNVYLWLLKKTKIYIFLHIFYS